MKRIYFDNNASAPLDPRVAESMLQDMQAQPGNPSSLHAFGRARRRTIEEARESIASHIESEPYELLFCSGATEANNLALYGLAARAPAERREILLSPTEHPSVLAPARALEKLGFRCRYLPVDSSGRLILAEALPLLSDQTALTSLMWINNETGLIQPVEAWAEAAQERGIPFHCDAVQALGRIPVAFAGLGADLMTFSAHKFHGPLGSAGLVVRRDSAFEPLLLGGGQERDKRAGTENALAIFGMAKALDLAVQEMDSRASRILQLSQRLWDGLSRACPQIRINTGAAPRWPGTLNLRVPGTMGESLLMKLDLAGIAVSLGSACSSGALEPSHVLEAMGLSIEENLSSIRVSISAMNDEVEVDRFLAVMSELFSPS